MSAKLMKLAVFGLIAASALGGCTTPGTVAATTPSTAAPVPAYGGNVTTTGGVSGYVGSAQSTVPGCPYIAWRLARNANGQVHGIVYYTDLSGVSMATGTVTPDGAFNLTLTSQMGNGPTGTIVGHRMPDGAGDATLTGPGCANTHVVMQGVSNMSEYHQTAG